jgi:hypothetical protein
MALHFSVVKKREVAHLLASYHYIGSQCADPTYAFAWRSDGGLFGDSGEPMAAALFAPSAARAWGPKTLELTRLVRHPSIDEPLTKFLSQCLRFLSKTGRFDLVVSYADPSAGHHGGIYQAASWVYLGTSTSKVTWIHAATGRRSSQRSFAQSNYKESDGWQKSKTGKKYIYAFPLHKSKRNDLNCRRLPYPKPLSP